MTWRFYAQRPMSGEWLSTDVQMSAEITEELSRPGVVRGTIPAGLDTHMAADGYPMWLERGTLLYAEQDDTLEWCGFCSYTKPTPQGRTLEFTGLFGAFQQIPYDGEYAAWRPRVLDVVTELVTYAQRDPRASFLGFDVKLAGIDPGGIGDEKPPARPKKPGRRKGETKENYDDRLLTWEEAVDDWDVAYKGREKYRVAWFEAPYVGVEIDNLADEVPFEYREVHRWTDRANLQASHTLELAVKLGKRRQDAAFIDGINLARAIEPESDTEGYANDVIVLGAGEGRAMKRGRAAIHDARIWSAKTVNAKNVKAERRLRLLAQQEANRSQVAVRLAQAQVWDTPGSAPVSSLNLGDEVWVQSDYTTPAYGAWNRIVSITRSTADSSVATLAFG